MPTLFLTGSTGIAAATARMWPDEEPVFVFGSDADSCEALAAELSCADFAVGDVRDESSVARAVEQCVARFGSIDSLFNVAGISARRFGDGPLHECTLDGWNAAISVNATGTFIVCREVLKHWLAAGRKGTILNMSTALVHAPEPQRFGTVAYAASKGAVEALSLAAAAAYVDRGIRINVIAPGLVKTPMSARAQADADIQCFIKTQQPLTGGMMEAGQVARTALLLLRDDSLPISGQVITVDGGWSLV